MNFIFQTQLSERKYTVFLITLKHFNTSIHSKRQYSLFCFDFLIKVMILYLCGEMY
jgi:hypothetical protein